MRLGSSIRSSIRRSAPGRRKLLVRTGLATVACRLLFVASFGLLVGEATAQQHPRPSSPPQHSSSSSHGQPHQAQPHLNEWLQRNRGLNSQQQAQKLQQERGFSQLPAQQQQRLTRRLQQLNQMPADQRQRTLERMENMERLPAPQQQQIRGSAAQLGQMAPERQQAVREAMRSLRNVPPAQRQAELNSSRYASQLNPQERGVVSNLLTVEPYHPQATAPQ